MRRGFTLDPDIGRRGYLWVAPMWEQISGFLFDNDAIAGLQFENWMWVIGVPALLAFGYFCERGFPERPATHRAIDPVDNPRAAVLASWAGGGA